MRVFNVLGIVCGLLLGAVSVVHAEPGRPHWDFWEAPEHGRRHEYRPEVHSVPELDGSTAVMAAGLVGGGLALVSSRRKRRGS